MSLASQTYYQLALQAEKLMQEEKDVLKQKEYRKVAGQNFFYSAMEALEWKLQQAGIDLYSINSHQDRLLMVKKNSNLFKKAADIILKLDILINYDYRRKVAYKGENGNKFMTLKELAQLCQEELHVR